MAEQYFTYMNGSEPKPGVRETYSYQADVTSFDLENWALTSKTCELGNLQALKRFHDEMPKTMKIRIKRNRMFGILSDYSETYPQELRIAAEDNTTEPLPICPIPDEHRENRKESPLCIACPTCWSSQRVPGRPRKHNTRVHSRFRRHILTMPPPKRNSSKQTAPKIDPVLHKINPAEQKINPASAHKINPLEQKINPLAHKINPAERKINFAGAHKINPSDQKINPAAHKINPAEQKISSAANKINTAAPKIIPAPHKTNPASRKINPDAPASSPDKEKNEAPKINPPTRKKNPDAPALSPVKEKNEEAKRKILQSKIRSTIKTRSKVMKLNTLGLQSSSSHQITRSSRSRNNPEPAAKPKALATGFRRRENIRILRHHVVKSVKKQDKTG